MKLGSKERRRFLATGLAAAAHVLVLLGLGFRIPHIVSPPRSDEDEPSVELTLVRPAPRPTPQPPTRPGPAPAYAPRAPLIAPAPDAPPSIPLPPSEPPAPNLQANDEAERLRNTLRGLTACGSAHAERLTDQQRRDCNRRLAQAAPAPVHPDFSSGEVAAFDADKAQERMGSILTRKLHNNCLPRLGDRPSPQANMGRTLGSGMTTTSGIGCSFSF